MKILTYFGFRKILLIALAILFLFLFRNEPVFAMDPNLSGIAVHVEDQAGNRITNATVQITLFHDYAFLYCNYPNGKKTGTYTAYFSSISRGAYLLDNVCCTISAWDISVTASGYARATLHVDNPWLTGQNRSTYLVNDGSYGWGGVIKLTPIALPPTNTPTPTRSPTPTSTPSPTPTRIPTSIPTRTPTPTPTPTSAPTPTPTKIPPSTASPTRTKIAPTTKIPPSTASPTRTKIAPTTKIPPLSPSNTPVPTKPPTLTKIPPLSPSNTPVPTNPPSPTLTPTPSFNPAACKCDGIEYTALFSGQSTTITSYGKVEGADTSKAIVRNQSFFLAEGAETIARIIGRSGPIGSMVVSSTPEKVRYQSKWTFTLPQLKTGATYRIWSQINCQPKLQAINYSPTRKTVFGTSIPAQPKSFIDRMIEFLNNLFGVREAATTTSTATPTSEPGTGTGIILEELAPTGKKSLQLEPIYPLEVYQKTCSFIKFRSGQFGQ